MKTKTLYFFVLWAMLVLVQISAVLLIDFTNIITTTIVTASGTMLTLYLGLKVERKRVQREDEAKQQAQLDKLIENVMTGQPTPIRLPFYADSRPVTFDSSDDRIYRPELFDYTTRHPSNVIQFPQPSSHLVIDKEGEVHANSLMDRDWKSLADNDDTEIIPEPGPDICKHCYRQIKDGKHIEGMNRGKIRCAPEDTLGGYGYEAEATGSDCGPNCLGS